MKSIFKFLFLSFSTLSAFSFSEEYGAEKSFSIKTEANFNKLLDTTDGFLLAHGWDGGFENSFDTSKLTKEEKKHFIQKGLQKIIQTIDKQPDEMFIVYAEVLLSYYSINKETRKKMYWSFKGAEKGSSLCMRILADAYIAGEGVVQDYTESTKWIFLAAALGDTWSQNWLQENSSKLIASKQGNPIITEAKKRASEWIQQHPCAFFSKD